VGQENWDISPEIALERAHTTGLQNNIQLGTRATPGKATCSTRKQNIIGARLVASQ